jgi:hypothetical protein
MARVGTTSSGKPRQQWVEILSTALVTVVIAFSIIVMRFKGSDH